MPPKPRAMLCPVMGVAFKELARVFGRLERLSSSSAMIGALADFLPRLSPAECRMTAYLLSGKVGPSFSAPEFGMAQRMVTHALARAHGISDAAVARMAVRSGDVGAVAEQLAAGRGTRPAIGDVFAALTRITRISGPGTQERKIDELSALLNGVSAIEAKYVVRTVLGTHRIGAAEMTFLYGLAAAFGRSKEDKPALEYAYGVLSDLGEVAFRVSRGGIEALSRVAPKPGVPVRMMLASRVEAIDEIALHLQGDLFVEYKYDGERVQIHENARGELRVFSRRLEDITHQYPELLACVRKQLRARTAIIEGEVVAIDAKTRSMLPFQVVMQRKRRLRVDVYAKAVPVALFVFDLLYLNGKSLVRKPLSERKRLLQKHLTQGKTLAIGEFIRTDEASGVERYFHRAIAHGAEGVVVKAASGRYQPGRRGWNWIKFKKEYAKELADTFDVVVVGALHGKGSRAGRYGSLLVAAFDPRTNKYYSLTKVGAGMTDALLRTLPKTLKPYLIPEKHRLVETAMKMDVWFEPAQVVEISGADLTVSPVHTVARSRLQKGGIALRFPRLLRLRNDKSAEQATTVQELWNMYKERMRSGRAA